MARRSRPKRLDPRPVRQIMRRHLRTPVALGGRRVFLSPRPAAVLLSPSQGRPCRADDRRRSVRATPANQLASSFSNPRDRDRHSPPAVRLAMDRVSPPQFESPPAPRAKGRGPCGRAPVSQALTRSGSLTRPAQRVTAGLGSQPPRGPAARAGRAASNQEMTTHGLTNRPHL